MTIRTQIANRVVGATSSLADSILEYIAESQTGAARKRGSDIVTATPTIANTAVPFVSALSELLTRHVQQQPASIAIGTSDLLTTINYRELDALVRSAMAQLSRIGLKPGNTIALLSDTRDAFVLGLLALTFSGARVAPLNPA